YVARNGMLSRPCVRALTWDSLRGTEVVKVRRKPAHPRPAQMKSPSRFEGCGRARARAHLRTAPQSPHAPMTNGLSFRHPLAFWFGCALLVGGVFAHAPMFMMGQHTHWQMVGMPMTTEMWLGMAAIPVGLALATFGMLPRLPGSASSPAAQLHFHVADGVALNRAHLGRVAVLVVALGVDVMRAATLGFVMPGMRAEYAIGTSEASLLALFALTGTTVGSIFWGRIADHAGRRAAILLSALMFMGTAIC